MNGDHLLAHRHGGYAALPDAARIIDFSVNLSPIAPPIDGLSLDAAALGPYPSIDGAPLRDFYVSRFGLDRSCVVALNGAIEGIYLLPRALSCRRVLIPQPAFFDYSRACRLAGARTIPLPLKASEGFRYPDIDAIARALEGCDTLLTGRPNNPTGTLLPKEHILELADRFPDKMFIVDEAFIQYTEGFPGSSLMQEAQVYRNIAVIHSLTKFYALAGLRLGAAVAHPETIRKLYEVKEPWTVNAVAESVAGMLLQCGAWEESVRSVVGQGRHHFRTALSGHPLIDLSGGEANFFLATLKDGCMPDDLLGFLETRGIAVRDCRNFEGIGRDAFRFAIRSPEENLQLVQALDDFAGRASTVGEVAS